MANTFSVTNRLAQIVLGLAGALGAYFHTFPTIHEEYENYPVLDVTTIAWLGVIVVAFILPKIREVTFRDLSVKFREATESSEAFRDASADLANLAQNWSTSSLLYLTLLESATLRKSATFSHKTTYAIAWARLANFSATLPIQPYESLSGYIMPMMMCCVLNIHLNTPTQETYRPGEGFVGQAFLEQRWFREPDIRLVPSYKLTRDGDPPYLELCAGRFRSASIQSVCLQSISRTQRILVRQLRKLHGV